jgi:CHAT domain-containing protein/tetratricopeptide (TPR) repeat protein
MRYGKLIPTILLAVVLVLSAFKETNGSVSSIDRARPSEPRTLTQESKPTDVRELKQGQPIDRELTAGSTHTYKIALSPLQYMHIEVEQFGINVEVALSDSKGEQIASLDWWWRERTESIWALAESGGDYILKIKASSQLETGKYNVKIDKIGQWQQAPTTDRDYVNAHKLYAEGDRLLAQGTAESLPRATEKFQAALALWRGLKDIDGEAYTLNQLGLVQYNSGNLKQAIEPISQALVLFRASVNRRGEAGALAILSTLYNFSGETQKALDSYNQALPLARAINDYADENEVLSGLGLVLHRLGQTQKALDILNELISLSHARGIIDGEAVGHNNIGLIYVSQGRLREAADEYSKTLSLLEVSGDKLGRATTLNNIGNAYTRLGEFQKALGYLLQGLDLARSIGDRRREAYNLASIGFLYIRLEDYTNALEYYNKSLELCRALGLRDGEHTALSNLGTIYIGTGELPKALECLNQALSLAGPLKNRSGEASNLGGLAGISSRLGDQQKALEYYDKALQIRREIADQYGESYVLLATGVTYAQLNNQQKAFEYFNRALTLAQSIGDKLGEAANRYQLARIARARGEFKEAQSQIETTLKLVESTRTKITLTDARATYFASRQDFYHFYIDLLMQFYRTDKNDAHLADALQTNERRIARSLLDILAESRADIRSGVSPELLKREHDLQQDLNAKADQQLRLLSRKHTPEQADVLAKEIAALTTEHEHALTQVRQSSPRYAALTQPIPLGLTEIQARVLDPETILLEYSLGEQRSYLWTVSSTAISVRELPSRAEIESLARRFYELLTARNQHPAFETSEKRNKRIADADSQYSQTAATLSEMLLGPARAEIKNKRLLIVPDGVLNYIPFAALPSLDGPTALSRAKSTPLIASHEVVSMPSASTLSVLRQELAGRQTAPKMVTVLADPVFAANDPRVKLNQSNAGRQTDGVAAKSTTSRSSDADLERSARDVGEMEFPRLPHSRQEANGIVAFASRDTRMESLDFEASRTMATSPEISNYRIIHFATHGFLNSQHPLLSGIVLSLVDQQGQPQDGFLRLNEIYDLKLGADLVVLSACRTALGKEIKGEGLIGLTRGFMYAGAPRVVASLWAVDDEITADLMTRFYREMLVKKQRPAAALRAAQVSIWREKGLPPFYWAAFVLQGEWR